MFKVVMILVLVATTCMPANAQSGETKIFEILAKPIEFPHEPSVGSGIEQICKLTGLAITIPDEIRDIKFANRRGTKGNASKIMVQSCLLVYLNETQYDLMVRNKKVSIVAKSHKSKTEYCKVYDLWGLDNETIKEWKTMTSNVIAPSRWNENDYFIAVSLENNTAIVQCTEQMHQQIQYFNMVLRSFPKRRKKQGSGLDLKLNTEGDRMVQDRNGERSNK